ncbi:MAG: hypothetical protein HZA90_06860 [Verrucomicrobia bacterium]|nr:hypothetical protein [Verrucomicrobiota bacterium]
MKPKLSERDQAYLRRRAEYFRPFEEAAKADPDYSRKQPSDARFAYVYYLNEKKYGPSVVNSPMKHVFQIVKTRVR